MTSAATIGSLAIGRLHAEVFLGHTLPTLRVRRDDTVVLDHVELSPRVDGQHLLADRPDAHAPEL
ncbi:MAG: hypothetical protein LBV00_04555, partial [Propionibacteriaceae bacterium]|nr:hypothetical protein [Propionibacteriaceae bacterium]